MIKDTINKLEKLKIQEIDININNLKLIGKGKNAKVYKSTIDNNPVTIKIMDLYLDTSLIKSLTMTDIISQTGINDIIISNLISKINHPIVQKFYGYQVTDKSIIMVKEWCDYDFRSFVKKCTDQNVIANLLLHYILGLRLVFQELMEGYMIDTKIDNILVRKYNDKYVNYKINGKDYKIRAYGFVPVLTDFGASVITKINNDKLLINRHMDWKKQEMENKGYWIYHSNIIDMTYLPNNFIFDKALDLFHLFYIRIYLREKQLQKNWIIQEYIKLLNKHTIHPINDYKPNMITIDDFLDNISDKIQIYK